MGEQDDVFINEVWDVVEVDDELVQRVRSFVDGEMVAEHIDQPDRPPRGDGGEVRR